MSEEDYRRGLRGGDCRVSISDWDRYSDWKAGRDEYERALDAEINAATREIKTLNDAHGNRCLGSYDCPYCLQTSLKDGASRCPLCRSDITSDYWQAARAKRKADEEARIAAVARQRVLNEEAAALRETTAQAAAAEWRRVQKQKETRELAFQGCLMGPLYGGVLLGFAGCVSCFPNGPTTSMTSFNLISGAFYGAVIGAVVGPTIGLAISSLKD